MDVDFQRKVDRYVGGALCRLVSLLPSARARSEDAPRPERILVILLSEMGSLFLARPMLNRLRERYPDASLYALVFERNREVLELLELVPDGHVVGIRNDSLRHLIRDSLSAVKTLRFIGIDASIDCELFSRASALYSWASGAKVRAGFEAPTQEGLYRGRFVNRPVLYNPYQHIAEQFVTLAEAVEGRGAPSVKRPVGAKPPALPPMRLADDELETARKHLESSFPEVRDRKLVLLYPGGGLLPIRAWPLASYESLAEELSRRGFLVGIIGLADDKPLARAIQEALGEGRVLDLTGYTKTVRELMVLFHLAELLVTNDGGPGHFAAMTPIPSVILYGPETPALYGSLGERTVHLFKNLSCSPCLSAYNHRKSPCDGDNQCLKTISVDEVLEAAQGLLATESSSPRRGVTRSR